MEFLSWHYTYALNFYLLRFRNALLSMSHQLSLGLLLPSLFAPWKRLVVVNTKKGFHPFADLEILSFNVISRLIGAVVRIMVFIFGSIALAMICLFGIIGFGLWVILPILSYSLYRVYKNQPAFVVKALVRGRSKLPARELWNSYPGIFLLRHLGTERAQDAFPETLELTTRSPKLLEDLMKNILENNKVDESLLRKYQITVEDLILTAHWWDERRAAQTVLSPEPSFKRPGIGMSLLFGYTPTLDKYVTDMGGPREFTHHLIGRGDTVSRVVRVLTAGRGVMLTGVPGVGKKTVVYELARRAAEGQLGQNMSYKRILDFDYNALFASASHDINAKKTLFAEILKEAEMAGNVILVIRDIFRLTNSEVEGVDFTDVITQALEGKRLFIVSVMEKSDYTKYISRNNRLTKYFEEVSVYEMSKEDALPVLLSAARYSEKSRGIIAPVPVVEDILKGSAQYLTDIPFPEKSLELLDAVLLYHEEHSEKGVPVTRDEVQAVLSERTGIALASLGEGQKKKLAHLEDSIHERLVNQTYPVSLLAKALRAKTSGVVTSARPIGSFLFLGPTGVGKTETAKVLAEIYFGSEDKIVRFDMSEFAGSEAIERLIGNAGKNIPGVLTTALKNNPACLLLLDEIEKAPSAVFNLFLSLLDEGRITDAFGRIISASHVFVIATSNAGSEYIREVVQKKLDKESLQKRVLDYVLEKRLFTPEFLNRFDGVVVYEPLNQTQLKEVAKRLLKRVSADMREKGIIVDFDESVYEKVVEEGYDPALGARPMRRMIELKLGDVLAQGVLASEIQEGDHIIMRSDGGSAGFVWSKS